LTSETRFVSGMVFGKVMVMDSAISAPISSFPEGVACDASSGERPGHAGEVLCSTSIGLSDEYLRKKIGRLKCVQLQMQGG
jgi:hypothetical protein